MIVHFVAQEFTHSYLTPDARRIDISEEVYDPLSGVSNFHSFFGRIDGREEQKIMRLDTDKVKKAFWDREEFLEALREICQDDVYLQASDYYSMRMMFTRLSDHDLFAARVETEKYGMDVRLDNQFHGEVKAFLDTLDVTRFEYDCTLVGNDHNYRFREKAVGELVEIKFAFTKPGDHSKPKPSLQAAYAQIAQTVPMGSAPPETLAA